MTITLTREEAQQVLDAFAWELGGEPIGTEIQKSVDLLRARLAQHECVCGDPDTAGVHRQDGPCYQQPEPEYRDVVIKNDLWRIEFLPDHAASVVLVRANYEAQPEPEPVASAESWFALVMCAAAEIEDASYGLRDEEAKRKAISGAKHYRDAANALYIAPPQREWQSLTDEEITVAWNEAPRIQLWVNAFARAIEAKLKEKNA
jgi:hypothetical protein